MFLLPLRKFQILQFCLVIFFLQATSTALKLKPGKHPTRESVKNHGSSPGHHISHHRNDSLGSRRSTYRINLPLKVARLLFPQMTNRNAETVIRIYPDKYAQAQNKTGSNLMLSVNYNKLNDESSPNMLKPKRRACNFGACPNCCPGCCSVCCPGCNCRPAPTMPGMCICPPRPMCQTCCMSCSAPPPPPPPPKPPPAPPCPMACLPICPPCPKPCPCPRPPCIPRPCIPRPCRIPAPPITGPVNRPCVPAPPVMGPCHPPCMPQEQAMSSMSSMPIHPAPPMFERRPGPVVVDHPFKGPPIYIEQCRDSLPQCKAYAKSGMCNHPSPFHNILQIRKLCAFSCGVCNGYDENAALLRRQSRPLLHVPAETRAKLNRALETIMRNKFLTGHSTTGTQRNKLKHQELQSGEKKSHATVTTHPKQKSQVPPPFDISESSGSAGSADGLEEIT